MVNQTSSKQLKQFGIIFALLLSTIFGVLLPLVFNNSIPFWPFIISGIFLSLSIFAPNFLARPYQIWIYIGNILSWINTRIILGLIFFLLFIPIGLWLKLLKKDPINKAPSNSIESYRTKYDPKTQSRFDQPF